MSITWGTRGQVPCPKKLIVEEMSYKSPYALNGDHLTGII